MKIINNYSTKISFRGVDWELHSDIDRDRITLIRCEHARPATMFYTEDWNADELAELIAKEVENHLAENLPSDLKRLRRDVREFVSRTAGNKTAKDIERRVAALDSLIDRASRKASVAHAEHQWRKRDVCQWVESRFVVQKAGLLNQLAELQS